MAQRVDNEGSDHERDLRASQTPTTSTSARAVTLQPLADVMAALRAPDGCPWDRAQTHATLRRFLLEEAYEVAHAIDGQDPAVLRDELGDLLMLVVLNAQIADEAGHFALQDVVDAATHKMRRRHPHVFGEAPAAEKPDWHALKRAERGDRPLLDGIARSLPALTRAERIGERVAAVGFDWPCAADVLDKVDEELAELREAIAASGPDAAPAARAHVAEELGDLLFAVANLARKLALDNLADPADIDADHALHQACDKFARRFAAVERAALARGQRLDTLDLDTLESLWQQAKRLLRDAEPGAPTGGPR